MEKFFNIKFTWMEILLWLFALIYPIFTLAGALLFFILINFITGYSKNKKLYNMPFNTDKARKGVKNFVWYTLAIMVAHFYDKLFLNIDTIALAKIIAAGITLIEVKSIYSNLTVLTNVNLVEILKNKLS